MQDRRAAQQKAADERQSNEKTGFSARINGFRQEAGAPGTPNATNRRSSNANLVHGESSKQLCSKNSSCSCHGHFGGGQPPPFFWRRRCLRSRSRNQCHQAMPAGQNKKFNKRSLFSIGAMKQYAALAIHRLDPTSFASVCRSRFKALMANLPLEAEDFCETASIRMLCDRLYIRRLNGHSAAPKTHCWPHAENPVLPANPSSSTKDRQ